LEFWLQYPQLIKERAVLDTLSVVCKLSNYLIMAVIIGQSML